MVKRSCQHRAISTTCRFLQKIEAEKKSFVEVRRFTVKENEKHSRPRIARSFAATVGVTKAPPQRNIRSVEVQTDRM